MINIFKKIKTSKDTTFFNSVKPGMLPNNQSSLDVLKDIDNTIPQIS